ncbi:docking protein 2 isoform X2 [Hyla sarda]|uniref:docking protein 2 isoform X2 n=1 Tax=Hyla sarda TaxID=327740 RepID=UPI0024C268DB|nr:docking protein 2 isoform X2 [Hyla sarda]
MDGGLVKQGALYVQHQQRFGKKWKKVWALLYEATSNGLARLEMYEGFQPPETGRKQECWKLLQLSECVSLSDRCGENCPKDTRVFSIETAQRVYLIACEICEQPNWIRALCSLAFPQERRTLERTGSQPLIPSLQLQENTLYGTSKEASAGGQFAVRVRQTEASSRCGLSGMYTLVAEDKCLSLRDRQTGNVLFSWPYPYLRRFGRDKTMFSFEAGRRCASGEGNFEFETSHGSHIFQSIEAAIKASHIDSPAVHEQHHEDGFNLPRQPVRSASLAGVPTQSTLPKNNTLANQPIPESEYAVPFDKVAQNLLATGFGGLLGPNVPPQAKTRKFRKPEHIYDEPELAPVYDEPEGIRVDAWKSQATDAHEIGYEYPYLPGWDDYAVPRGAGKTCQVEGKEEEEEWGAKGTKEREYDNITLRGAKES